MTETRLDITITARLDELHLREDQIAELREVLQDLFVRRWQMRRDDLQVHVRHARRAGSDSSTGQDRPRSEDAGALRLTHRIEPKGTP